MGKFKKKKILIVLGVVLGISLISIGVVKAMNQDDEVSVFVKTARVEKQDLNADIMSSGVIKAKDQMHVVSNLPYNIIEVLVEEGTKVSKGDVLAKLDTKDLAFKVKTAEINLELEKDMLEKLTDGVETFELQKNLESAKASYDHAKEVYEKSKKLFDAGAISEAQLNSDQVALTGAKNQYELAQRRVNDVVGGKQSQEIESQKKKIKLQELTLQAQREAIEDAVIKSPMDGTVVLSNAKIGLMASTLSPMFIVDDTNHLQIEVDVSEYDVNDLALGQRVKITGDAFNEQEFEGAIAYIAPVANVMQTNAGIETNIKVKLDILNPTDILKPGFSADVSIRTKHKENLLVGPYEVIYQKKDGSEVVFRAEDNKAVEVPIETGISGDIKVELISDELKEGDALILNPTEKFEDGMAIQVTNKGEKDD